MLKSMLVNNDFQVWHLIEPIRNHVRKSLLIYMHFDMDLIQLSRLQNICNGVASPLHKPIKVVVSYEHAAARVDSAS